MFYILLLNMITFILMFIDKKCAVMHLYRIPEAVFFLLGFIGGAIGVYLGMFVFRHKTRKLKFRLFFPIVLLIQGYFLYLAM
ncbi:MAG: DUF1294 domain-containing protein [Erysipelotrichaceae bacterium]